MTRDEAGVMMGRFTQALAPGARRIELAGEPLDLLPQRAAFHGPTATLLVADVHLGKAASFRALGVPVPAGTTQSTLHRLEALVRGLSARTLIILGDLLHSDQAHQAGVVQALAHWRRRHPGLLMKLVPGNHDARAGALAQDAGVEVLPIPAHLGPWRLLHEPDEDEASAAWIAGHVHPVHGLKTRGDRLRLPAFWRAGSGLVLPAFGDFTGGWAIPAPSARNSFVTDGARVYSLSLRAPG
jgi:DNA ligase-associated metallophosphoesterase